MAKSSQFIQNTIAVAASPGGGLYVLTSVYPESDALNPSGQLLIHDLGGEEMTRCVLNTSSPLAALWTSPNGDVWLASSDGTVWTTTAAVDWPPPGAALQTEILDEALNWRVAQLPKLKREGYAPNLTAIWGTSNGNVFCSTASGSVYLWDGKSWQEGETGFQMSLTEIHGISANDVYCVGYQGAIAHFNGKDWNPVPVNGISVNSTIITGVWAVSSTQVLASTNRGALLVGNRQGFAVVATAKMKFMGVVQWQERIILCGSPGGAWEFVDNELRPLKENFAATDLYPVGDRLYLIETDQPQGPAAVEYWPERQAGASQWQRIVF